MKTNCWEFKKCGREPNGFKSLELGVCPVSTKVRTDGINSGKNGGRCCWVITGSLCGGKVQGSFLTKLNGCMNCEFYQRVFQEETRNNSWVKVSEVIKILNSEE